MIKLNLLETVNLPTFFQLQETNEHSKLKIFTNNQKSLKILKELIFEKSLIFIVVKL